MNKVLLLLRKIASLGELKSIEINGFKSLRSVKIEFPTRTTIMIGPNGSGKTAVIETFELLRDLIEYYKGRISNPLSKWWGLRSVSWMHQQVPIAITLHLNYTDLPDLIVKNIDEILKKVYAFASLSDNTIYEGLSKFIKEDILDIFKYPLEITYKIRIQEKGLKIIIKDEFNLRFIVNGVIIPIDIRLIHDRIEIVLNAKIVDYFAKEKIKFRKSGKIEPYIDFLFSFSTLSEKNREKIKDILEKIISEIINLLSKHIIDQGYYKINFKLNYSSFLELYYDLIYRELEKEDIANPLDLAFDFLLDEFYKSIEKDNTIVEIIKQIKNKDNSYIKYDHFLSRIKEIVVYTIRYVLYPIYLSIYASLLLIGSFIEGITVLKRIDSYRVAEPQPLVRQEFLKPDAGNLAQFLYTVGRGRLPGEVASVLHDLMHVDSVSGYFEPTPDGRVVFKLVIDDRLELMPPAIPSGVWKIMAIESALLSNPTVLLVDEFENSLHVEAQEYLLNDIRDKGVYAIIATHSPVLIDLAKKLDEILILEYKGYETKAYRIRETKELKEKLSSLGLTPSEAILYRLLGE